MKVQQSRVLLYAMLAFLSMAVGLVTNIATGEQLPSWVQPYTGFAWPILGVLGAIFVVLSILEARSIHEQEPLRSPNGHRDSEGRTESSTTSSSLVVREDWGEAPDAELFYGRETELALLQEWIVVKECRTVGIFGLGGIGKTLLATKIAKQERSHFDYVVWRSLRNAPPIEEILLDCIQVLSDQQLGHFPSTTTKQITLLVEHLRLKHCLLVLDNFEAILKKGDPFGEYLPGYEAYGELLRQIGTTSHQSCLLLTSREKPKELALLEGEELSVRSLRITGLARDAGEKLLMRKGLSGTPAAWDAIQDRYSGNPLALEIVAAMVREVFRGDATAFLEQDVSLFGGIRDLLDQQYRRLSERERAMLYWLAIEREPVSKEELAKNILGQVSKHSVVEALESLRYRSLIEQTSRGFSLQNVVMEYVTDRLIDQACDEIGHITVSLLNTHLLLKAQSKEYVRASQHRLILYPVVSTLTSQLGNKSAVAEQLMRIVSLTRLGNIKSAYVGGNVLNLLCELKVDLRGYDFSGVAVRQAYLTNTRLPEVNFSRSNLSDSVFASAFSGIPALTFHPSRPLLAIGTMNGEVLLWDTHHGKQVATLAGHSDWVRSVVFSPDGRLLASGSSDKTIRLWDVQSQQLQGTYLGSTDRVRALAFSPDGEVLVSGGEDKIIRFWNVNTGELFRVISRPSGLIRSLTLNNTGSVIAVTGGINAVELWNFATGDLDSLLAGHSNWPRALSFSADGRLLASGGDDTTIRVWEVTTGRCIDTLLGHEGFVESLNFSPDSSKIVSCSGDKTVRLWDIASGKCLKTMSGHTSRVRSVEFSQDGSIIASGSEDQTVRIWESETGHCLRTLQGYINPVWCVAFSPDGLTLATGTEDQVVRLWNVRNGRLRTELRWHSQRIRSIAFGPGGRVLASGSEDRAILLWDIASGQIIRELYGHTEPVWSLVFSHSGRVLASGGDDNTIRLWDVETGQCFAVLRGHQHRVRSVAFNRDDSVLASGSGDHSIRLWNTTTGECQATLQHHTNGVSSVAFSPDGLVLASGSEDQLVILWDVSTQQPTKILDGHTNRVRAVSFSPDGHRLASGSEDLTVRLWNVNTGECTNTLKGHTRLVYSLSFSPTDNVLASSSDDETVMLWNIDHGICLATLRAERPYELMNITDTEGLTVAQKASLKLLGAVES